MCCRKYFQDNFPSKPCWNEGWILYIFRWLFSILNALSICRNISWCIVSKSTKWAYIFVDFYVSLWLGLIIWLFIRQAHIDYVNIVPCWLIAIVSYRLFDIFQSWVGQFVLGGVPKQGWQPISKYRSLVLVFLNYIETVVVFGFLALIFNDAFKDLTHRWDALYFSLRNAITIGTNVQPVKCIDYVLFYTQMVFVLLFLTAAIQSIISYKEEPS